MLAGVLLLLGIPPAFAHDELTESEPEPNSSLEEPPPQLTLSFSGDLATLGAQVQVNGPLGSATEGDPVTEGGQVHQDLSAAGGPGDYEVIWRATSRDGHPISGSFGYTVLGTDEDSDATQTERSHDPDDAESEDSPASETKDPESTHTEDSEPTSTEGSEPTESEDSEPTGTGDSADTSTQDSEPTETGDSEDTSTQDSEDTSSQDADDTATQDSEDAATSTAPAAEADQAARTDAVVIASEPNSAGGMAPWMWALIGVALVALAGVGTVAMRRR